MTLEELGARKDIVERIDLDLTPQEAFLAYQVKSVEGWRQRGLPETYFFYVDVWRGEVRLVLVKRKMVNAQEVAAVEMDERLLMGCLEKNGGSRARTGQYPIDEAIKARLKQGLGIG